MPKGIAYQNKDILFKILSEHYPRVSFKVYGLNVPAVKAVLPTELPDISANTRHADGLFLLEDNSLLLIEYESSSGYENLLKYGHYAFRILERYHRTKKRLYNIRIVVVYTSDVESAPASLNAGGLRIDTQQIFLKNINGDDVVKDIRAKIESKRELSDEDILRLIVAPLAKSELSKQDLLEKCVSLAKEIENERLQAFTLAGLLVASDKFVDREYSGMIRRWLKMTKVGQLIQEEIEAAAAKAAKEAAAEATAKTAATEKREIAKNLLRKGMALSDVAECTGLPMSEAEMLV
jgi:predicted transposase/invertase (TIGR01784 family)